MKLRNKKTREVLDLIEIVRLDDLSNEFYLRLSDNEGRTFKEGFNSLVELNAEWEDASEEPKDYWYLNCDGDVIRAIYKSDDLERSLIAIGNYFETPEEAEKAVEKLMAWKRLKDKGFKFTGYDTNYGHHRASFIFKKEAWATETEPDIELLFGGEE